MPKEISEFVQALSNDGEAIGLIPGRELNDVLQVWNSAYGGDGVLRVRLPYQPGRKDRQLAAVLLQMLEQPMFSRSVSTAKAWEEIARQCRERGCRLVVIENADLLDRDSLTFVNRRYLPAVILVGGERLAQRVFRNAGYAGRILSWGESQGVA